MQSRVSRVARGWIAGSFATGVAAVGHGLADGSAPSTLAILVGVVFAGLLGTLAIGGIRVGRRPSLPRLTIVVAGSQVAFHLVFSWLSPGSAIPGTASPVEHHGVSTLFTPAVAPVIAHHGTDPWMWAAHTVALLATIVFLRRAELALWNLLREAFFDALRATALPTVAIEARPATAGTVPADAPRHPFGLVFFSVVTRRGPPALGFAP